MSDENLEAWVRERVERLRPRLLDLTKKNPLISTRLNPRTNSYVRVVDELPDVLAFNLGTQKPMRFDPLPALESDPVDEQTSTFKSAFAEAQRTDDGYIEAIGELRSDDPNSEDETRKLDRALKDKVREQLDMPLRETTGDISLARHAKLHGVSPDYDLPLPSNEHDDGRHRDDAIQTLLLPDQMERKLTALMTKCNTWIQETGINVLHGAYGFLEWQDNKSNKSAMSPLVLMPVAISKKKTSDGPEFWIKGFGENGETNLVLSEMLKRDFDINLPAYEGGSIEEYLEQVQELKPKNVKIRVRRQVAIGVFPSARMAMYHDLDPEKTAIHDTPIVSQLLGGSEAGEASPFADEHDVESPEIEKKIPCVVTEADSSQLSVLVDLADGRSLAVEGPPGTGKSQTIVNAIAASIAAGKKVLFVAEKMAALEVVKSRLEALGLGEFVLPLQAERSTREQVISSVRDRIEMQTPRAPRDYDEKLGEYRRLRSNLNAYVDTVSSPFGETGLSVYEALGKAIRSSDVLSGRDDVFLNPPISAPEHITRAQQDQAVEASTTVDAALSELRELPDYWTGITPLRYDKIELDQLRVLAQDSAEKFKLSQQKRTTLANWPLPDAPETSSLEAARDLLLELKQDSTSPDRSVFQSLCSLGLPGKVNEFVSLCQRFQQVHSSLCKIVNNPDELVTTEVVSKVKEIADKGQYETLDPTKLKDRSDALSTSSDALKRIGTLLRPLQEELPELNQFELNSLREAQCLISELAPSILRLRNPSNRDAEALEPLRLACEEGLRLRSDRSAIEEAARIPTDISSSELLACSRSLEQVGFFSLFSAEVRQAKRTVKALSKGKSPKTKDAATLLRTIAEWKDRFAEFEVPVKRETFGLHYKGIDTDFESFSKLAEFYDAVDKRLKGTTNRALRRLIKRANSETLLEIPPIEEVEWNGEIGDLERSVKEFDENANKLSEDSSVLSELAKYFVNLPSVSPSSLSDVLDILAKNGELRARADNDTTIADALGIQFNGAWTAHEELLWHNELYIKTTEKHSMAETIQSAIIEGSFLDLLKSLEDAIKADKIARFSLKELEDRSGKDFTSSVDTARPSRCAEYLSEASDDERGLSANASLARAYANLRDLGYNWVPLPKSIQNAKLSELLPAALYRAMAGKIMDQHGSVLNKFPGSALNEMRAKLANIDKQILSLSRRQLRALAASNSNPPMGRGTGPKSGWTELSLLQNEIAKQKRFVSVRDLTNRAGKSLQELKPCWMMSPLAVAQYLPAKNMRFDICIIDEASQMKPEDALGALARADQAMVVGDVNQLPPTNFFQKMVADDEEDEQGASVEEESILEISNAKLRPSRRLRWHYRSQHSDLIRFSNEVIYDSSLVIFPSSDEKSPNMGVSLVPVGGNYLNSVNPIEAKAIVEAATRFMRERPNDSLGIVTLNQKQRDLIILEMSYALDRDEQASQYVDAWNIKNDGLEKFFVKNLENVQGDERDVIFIGTVYGPNKEDGRVAQRFGPINGTAGRRRLNVLFTRAKKQIVTFSSLKPADITATEASNPGTNMLKRWLEYSGSNVLEREEGPYAETDSDFEDYVISQIRSMGCEAVPQVGCAGYRIDIGVKHPDWPYGFILAVECDGATYHSCRSARDRDRLRQEVLERLGWSFHRIWSTDWFNDPRAETERLRAKIERRLEELKAQSREVTDFGQINSGGATEVPLRDASENPTLDLFETTYEEDYEASSQSVREITGLEPERPVTYIEVGDTVRVRYLTDSESRIQVTISEHNTSPENGIIAAYEPLAEALLGAEIGDEVEVLIGSYVRKAVVENVTKAA